MSKSSYRKLHVNGVEYKYVIGKSFVKIVSPNGNDTVEKEKCGVTCNGRVIVTPGMIACYIQGRKIVPEDFFDSCGHDGAKLSLNPYCLEIENKAYFMIRCDKCIDKLACDI